MTEIYDKTKGHAVTNEDQGWTDKSALSLTLRDTAENLLIAIDMGWDIEGCVEALRAAIARSDEPLGFRTSDVPDPYKEGPQPNAEPNETYRRSIVWKLRTGAASFIERMAADEIERLSAENNWLRTALRAAQTAPAQSDAEPVAWQYRIKQGGWGGWHDAVPSREEATHCVELSRKASGGRLDDYEIRPLYTTPPRADTSAGLMKAAEINYILTTLKHARVFITSREKMHPTGVELYDELIERLRARAADRSGRDCSLCNFPPDGPCFLSGCPRPEKRG